MASLNDFMNQRAMGQPMMANPMLNPMALQPPPNPMAGGQNPLNPMLLNPNLRRRIAPTILGQNIPAASQMRTAQGGI